MSSSLRLPAAALACTAIVLGGTAVSADAAPAVTSARATTVHCQGAATACTARVSLAGGASNERVVVTLPAAGMRLESAKPTSPDLDGAYLVSDQAMRDGGRQYTFTLSAAEAPKGSALRLTFRKPGPATSTIVRCTGGTRACQAVVPISGGASNRRVVVQLPRTDLGLVSVKPSSPDLRGAYSMSRQRLRAGDSEYTFVLNAVQAAPRGAHLTLTFAQP